MRKMTGFRALLALMVAAMTLLPAFGQAADQAKGDPPQILTVDLVQRQLVKQKKMNVSFTIADSDKVVEVKVNGKKQSIQPGPTIQVTVALQFRMGTNMVEVFAKDEAGNSRTKNYFVEYYGPKGTLEQTAKPQTKK